MKFSSIQYLRSIAALGVVLMHASTALFDKVGLISIGFGGFGVDLFFVISGFVMFYTTADDKMAPDVFFVRRLIRIVPLYFILSAVAFLLAIMVPHSVNTFSSSPYDFARSVLFIPYKSTWLHHLSPELLQGWTLNYEIFFYAIFGVSLFLGRNPRLLFCLAVFTALSVTGRIIPFHNPIIATYTNSLLMEFFFGMLIGYALTARPAVFGHAALLGIGAALLVVAIWLLTPARINPVGPYRFVFVGIPSAAIVCGALWLERKNCIAKMPALLLIGDASYSLYLSHAFVLAILHRLWARFFDIHLASTQLAFLASCAVLSVSVSIVMFQWLERPITERLMAHARKWHAQDPLIILEPASGLPPA